MTTYDFDRIIDRRSLHEVKWTRYDEDVLPMWVADMDFAISEAIQQAMHIRIYSGTFGYSFDLPPLREAIVERMKRLYQWDITTDDILFPPGLVYGLGLVAETLTRSGDAILMHTPVYGPFLMMPPHKNRFAHPQSMIYVADNDRHFHYEIDYDRFAVAASNPQASLFYLCNPHNPGGHIYQRDELLRLAEICLQNNVLICSDEIHCDLLLDGGVHIPIAALDPEIAQHTITMMAPSKTFNLAGLACSFLIVPNADLRKTLATRMWSDGIHTNTLGLTAALAAYEHAGEWLRQLLAYLRGNRDATMAFFDDYLPQMRYMIPSATHLFWIDARNIPSPESIDEYLLKQGRVALNNGTFFGKDGEGFLRLNFATPRALLMEGLERIRGAIEALYIS